MVFPLEGLLLVFYCVLLVLRGRQRDVSLTAEMRQTDVSTDSGSDVWSPATEQILLLNIPLIPN